jgi:DNA-binding transcriptional ArsR family regulator
MTPRSLRLTDPTALRALAHPIRLDLIALLRRGGPLTATQAGERIGESPASCSFHLRQLAKYGLVEEAGGGRGRERPWQATAFFSEWAARGSDEEADAAGALLTRVVLDRYLQSALEWLDRQSDEDPEWADAAQIGDTIAYLTPHELRELGAEIRTLLEPYLQQPEGDGRGSSGSRAVNLIVLGFPLPEEPEADR